MQNPVFYNSTLKTWITPWTNEDRTVFAPLNDYTATVIGIIRDDRPFTEVLTGNTIYIGRGGASNNGSRVVPADYSQTDNVHYEQLESMGVDLSNPADFVPWNQDELPGSMLDASESAGIITSRAAGEKRSSPAEPIAPCGATWPSTTCASTWSSCPTSPGPSIASART